MKTFEITITGRVRLTVAECWPDGDAPANPTADDVAELLNEGTLVSTLRNWSLDDEFEFAVAERANVRPAGDGG